MVLVKCLQMSNGQGCRMTLVPNYPFHWRLRYFVCDGIAPLNMGIATTSCQKHAQEDLNQLAVAQRSHNNWLQLYMTRSRLPLGYVWLLYFYYTRILNKEKQIYILCSLCINPVFPQQSNVLTQPANQTASFQLMIAHDPRSGLSTYCNISIGTENGIGRKGNLETQNGLG